METCAAYGCLSVCFAFAGGSLFASGVLLQRGRQEVAERLIDRGGGLRGRAAHRLVAGYSSTMPCANLLLRAEAVERVAKRAVRVLEGRGYAASEAALTSVALVSLGVVFLLGSAAAGSLLFGAALAVVATWMLAIWLKSYEEKQDALLRECAPDALRGMAACFTAGLSLMQTFRHMSQTAPRPLRPLFDRSARVLETGGTVQESLSALKEIGGSDLAFVAAALDVQHQAGGPMAPVLEAACEAIEGELDLARTLRVQTAQAKLSARIVSIMPFALIALFSLVSDGFLAPFFASVEGLSLLALALFLQIAGIASVHRTLRMETAS